MHVYRLKRFILKYYLTYSVKGELNILYVEQYSCKHLDDGTHGYVLR